MTTRVFDSSYRTAYNGPTMESEPRARNPYLAVAVAITILAIVARFILLKLTHCTVEDAYITLRYAENLAQGHGFVYNFGERVLGTTTPLFTLLLGMAALLGLDALTAGKALCILADGAVCFLLWRLLASFGRPTAGLVAALLYATASAPINFSIGGMETALVTLAGLTAIYGYNHRRGALMAVSLALLFLLRIDGLLLAAALFTGWCLRERRIPWKLLALAILIALPWVLFATFYFGSPVPASATAKVLVYQRTRQLFLPNLATLRHQYAGDPVHLALSLVSLLGAVIAWRRHAGLSPALVWFVLYHLGILASRAPVEAFGWYLVPPLPVYYVATGIGLTAVGRFILAPWMKPDGRWRNIPGPALRLACICMLAAPLVANLRSTRRHIADAQRTEDVLRKPIGLWLAENTEPSDRVLLESIGYIGYFSRRPILDMVGLVSPEVIPSYRSQVQHPLGDIVARFRPEIMVLRQSEMAEIDEYARATGRRILGGEYRVVRGFPDAATGPGLFLFRLGSEM
jgi:hypothetical protein